MTIKNAIALYDFNGAVVTTIISIVFTIVVIALLFYFIRSKKRRNKSGMVHNKPKPNDSPTNNSDNNLN